METIKLATVCSGIGAPEKALKLLGHTLRTRIFQRDRQCGDSLLLFDTRGKPCEELGGLIPYRLRTAAERYRPNRGRDALSGLFYKRFGQRRRGGFRYKVKPYVVLRQTHCTDEAENRRVGERRRRSELQTLYDLP